MSIKYIVGEDYGIWEILRVDGNKICAVVQTNIRTHEKAHEACRIWQEREHLNMNDKPDFMVHGIKFAEIMIQAAEDLLTEATNFREKTKVLTDSIKQQVTEHKAALDDINSRVHALGKVMVEAHEKFLDGK